MKVKFYFHNFSLYAWLLNSRPFEKWFLDWFQFQNLYWERGIVHSSEATNIPWKLEFFMKIFNLSLKYHIYGYKKMKKSVAIAAICRLLITTYVIQGMEKW